jgi:Carboxypeptidase regulatory-like domain
MLAAALLAVLAQVSALPSPQAGSPPRDQRRVTSGTAIVRGRVVAADTGAPIRGCNVTLNPARSVIRDESDNPRVASPAGEPQTTQTNEDGRFEFSGLPPGTYRLSVWPDPANGRYVVAEGRTPWPSLGKPFDVATGQKLDVPVIHLPRAGVLSGRVVDEFGEPTAYVEVRALVRQTGGEPAFGGRSDSTDDLGRFRLFGLTPGDYFVVAEPRHMGGSGSDARVKPLPTYLPSAFTLAEATAVSVRAGQEVGDLEIRLVTGRAFKISGTITTSKGQPFSHKNGRVGFVERSGGGMSSQSVELRENGAFEIAGVSPGTYSLEIDPGFQHPGEDVPGDPEYAVVPIVVTGDDIEGLSIVTQPPVSIPGEVVFDDVPTQDPKPLEVTAVAAGEAVMWRPASRSKVASDGTFVLKGLYRPVYVRAVAPPGYHLASVAFDGQDITDAATQFKAGIGKLSVTLTRRASELSGQVEDSSEHGSSFVLAFGEDRSLWFSMATTTKSVHAGEDGKYRLQGLRPGRYLVTALSMFHLSPVERTPEQWESLAKHATPVTIGDNERKVLNLSLVSEIDR